MKIKLLFLFTLCFAIVSASTSIYAYNVTKIENKYSKEVLDFMDQIDRDIVSSFNLDIQGYEMIDDEIVINEEDYQSLKSIFTEVLFAQEVGDIRPTIYISNKGEGFIFEKKHDGKNNLYIVKKDKSGLWKLESKKSKQSKSIEPIGVEIPSKNK